MSRVRIPLSPRVSGWLVLAAACVLAITGLTQCRFVPSSVTGLEVVPNGFSAHSDCIQRCNDAFKDGREAESDRHRLALQACGSDRDCKRAETDLHEAKLQDLLEQMRDCKQGCYNEGGGQSGDR